MTKTFKFIGYLAALLLAVWSFGSWYVVKDIEEPSYQVLSKADDYEVRLYEPYIIAQTTVSGDYDDAMSDGFREIAGYIFGGNSSDDEISMTAPVLENAQDTPQQIAMTAPVLDTGTTDKRSVAFIMPSKYTLESLPVPNSDKVTFAEIPARKIAVLAYGFYANESRIEAKKLELLNRLQSDGVSVKGEVISARYNPPFSMPLFLVNEVMVEID
ncbi:MAG: hypothetical protein ACI9WC_001502 [Arenicella sp.]|jgi:hypothetical protein